MIKICLKRTCSVLFLAILPFVGLTAIEVEGELSLFRLFVVDSSGNVGEYSSLALDVNGNPRISYYDSSTSDLKYAKWTGTGWAVEFVDTWGEVGLSTSIALEASGNPWISYFDLTNGDLKVAKFTGSWSIETVDSNGIVGQFSSIALDGGNPAISYYDSSNGMLKYARWTGGVWNIETVDSAVNSGLGTSLAFDSDGHPHISYIRGEPFYDLMHATNGGYGWNIQTVDSSANTLGNHTSIALGPGQNIGISYYDQSAGDLKHAKGWPPEWTIEVVDSQNNEGEFSSLAVDREGKSHIAYSDRTDYVARTEYYLKYAVGTPRPFPETGITWVIDVLDRGSGPLGTGMRVGLHPSIAVDFFGNPRISYQDAYVFDLRFALPGISTNLLAYPPAPATAPANPVTGTAPLQVAFDAQVSGGKPPYTYLWTFGDGTTSNRESESHWYVAAGDYAVTLTVNDEFGQSWTGGQHILVRSGGSGASLGQVLSLVATAGVGATAGALLTILLFRRRKRGVSSD